MFLLSHNIVKVAWNVFHKKKKNQEQVRNYQKYSAEKHEQTFFVAIYVFI